MAPSATQRRIRWAAPFAVAATVVLIAAIPGLSAASTPSLPAITAAQLIAKVQQAKVTHLSATVDVRTNLGIPNLSELNGVANGGGDSNGQGFDPTSLLSGTHQALVWFDGPDKNRVDLLENMAEFDVIHNGADVWTWDSTAKQVGHFTRSSTSASGKSEATPDTATPEPAGVQTPQQIADNIVNHLSPSTAVSVGSTASVAGRSAYQLLLAPHSAKSTIDHVAIAVDHKTGLPLRVQVFAKGQKAAAISVGFGKLSLSAPAASRFTFKAPAGSTTTNNPLGGGSSAPRWHQHSKHTGSAATAPNPATTAAGHRYTVGHDWTSVVVFTGAHVPAQYRQYLKAGTSVSGSFGTGTVLQTALVNILVLDNGKVAVGAVNTATLEAAAAASH